MKLQLVSVGLFVLALSACGGDDDSRKESADSTKEDAGAAAQSGVPCGAKRCQAPDGYSGELCCHDSFSATCGQKTGPDECSEFPPVEDEHCPDATVYFNLGSHFVRGCCMDDGTTCGLDLTSAFNFASVFTTPECNTLDDAMVTADSSQPDKTTLPAPTHCDGSPL